MKSNPRLRPFTVTVSAALATLLIAPALWPEMEKRFMNWAVPEDAAPQARADSAARQAQNPAAASLVHGAISGILATSSSAREELPRGAAWPQITLFDLEFAHLGDTFHNASHCALTVPPYSSALTKFAKNGLSEETLQDPDFGATFLTMDSPLVRRWGLAFHVSQSGGVEQSDEALGAYAANLLATLVTSAEGSATWTSSDSLVSVSANTGQVDGRSVGAPGYSNAIWTPLAMQPALMAVVSAPQPVSRSVASYGFVAPPPPVGGSNAVWYGRTAGGALPAKLRPHLSTTAPSSLAATGSSVADRGVVSGRSNPFVAPQSAPDPILLSALSSNIPAAFARPSRTVATGTVLVPTTILPGTPSSTITSPVGGGLTFTNTYTGNWTLGTTAVIAAEAILSSIFNSSNVNVPITFDYGSGPGSGAYSSPNYYNETYSTLLSYMQLAALTNSTNAPLKGTVAHLPVSSPSTIQWILPVANAQALGLNTGGANAGTVTVGNGTTWDQTEADGTTAGQGDLTGVLMHEISHVLGRVDYAFANQPSPYLTPLDMSRYTVGGTFNFTNANAVFSIDGGVTALAGYSDVSDTGDWDQTSTPINDPNNAYFYYGVTAQWSTVDTEIMEALGWEIPEPGSATLAVLGGLGLVLRRRRRAAKIENSPAL